jgi:hypothetical protein
MNIQKQVKMTLIWNGGSVNAVASHQKFGMSWCLLGSVGETIPSHDFVESHNRPSLMRSPDDRKPRVCCGVACDGFSFYYRPVWQGLWLSFTKLFFSFSYPTTIMLGNGCPSAHPRGSSVGGPRRQTNDIPLLRFLKKTTHPLISIASIRSLTPSSATLYSSTHSYPLVPIASIR